MTDATKSIKNVQTGEDLEFFLNENLFSTHRRLR